MKPAKSQWCPHETCYFCQEVIRLAEAAVVMKPAISSCGDETSYHQLRRHAARVFINFKGNVNYAGKQT